MSKTKIGILGFGNLGQYLVGNILSNPGVNEIFELAFIQNRSIDKIKQANLPLDDHQIFGADLILDFQSFLESGHSVDMIIEASHPDVIRKHGTSLIKHGSLFITSLTALADHELFTQLKTASKNSGKQLFIPVGAGWGFADIKKMADANTLKSVTIEMEFHVDALKLNEPLRSKLLTFIDDDNKDLITLYNGPVKGLAVLAPNNTNTMCGLALAAHNLGFSQVNGILKASKVDLALRQNE